MESLDVLIVAAPGDVHAEAVMQSVTAQGAKVKIFSLDDLRTTSFTLEHGVLRLGLGDGVSVVDRRTTIWWRRSGQIPLAGLQLDDVQFVEDEAPHILRGALEAVRPRWVDDPFDVLRAEHKLVQLAVAESLKVPIPQSIVTNVGSTAAEFIASGPAIAKPLSPGYGIAPYTSRVSADDAQHVEALPALLQERVPASADVRVVVVGRTVFAWRRAREENTVDWRAVDPKGTQFASYEDEQLVASSLAITAGLGCTIGALDWLQVESGFVFLEINPRGQWLFLPGASESVPQAVAAHLLNLPGSEGGAKWPSLLQRIWFDLLPKKWAPPADGTRPPQMAPAVWLDAVAASPLALEVARRAHDDAREGVRIAEEKAGRLVQVGITLVAAALAVAAFQVRYAASRSLWWWISVVPASVSVVFLAVAALSAAQVDRVAHFRVPLPSDLAGHRHHSEQSALLEIEERGRRLAVWASNAKHSDLMQARAWFTRGLVALVVAGAVAVSSFGMTSADGAINPVHSSERQFGQFLPVRGSCPPVSQNSA